jgi:hypothetical protein
MEELAEKLGVKDDAVGKLITEEDGESVEIGIEQFDVAEVRIVALGIAYEIGLAESAERIPLVGEVNLRGRVGQARMLLVFQLGDQLGFVCQILFLSVWFLLGGKIISALETNNRKLRMFIYSAKMRS